MMKVMVDAITSLKVGKYLVKSFISITLTCFRSLASVRMAEEVTDDVLYLLALNHVLAGIEDEVLGALNILQMDLGVLEGQTRGDYFLNSIFDPSVKQCKGHPPPGHQGGPGVPTFSFDLDPPGDRRPGAPAAWGRPTPSALPPSTPPSTWRTRSCRWW